MKSLFRRVMASLLPLVVLACAEMPPQTADPTAEGIFPSGSWRPLADVDLKVVPGSILDFTSLFPDQVASAGAPVNVDAQGRLATGEGRRQRFLCAPLAFAGPHGGFPDHRQAEALAQELRRRGYNLVRFLALDNALMKNATRDFGFDATEFDRLHYLMAALRRQGIYWMLDVASSWNGAYAVPGNNRWSRDQHLLQLEVQYDPEARAHWLEMARRVLATVNPYSGRPPLGDPNLLAVTVINNTSLLLNLERRGFEAQKRRFTDWLARSYAPATEADRLQAFFALERATSRWMDESLRDLGYRGLTTGYNADLSALARLASRELPVISLHDFFDYPQNFIRPGNRQTGTSAIGALSPDLRHLAAARIAGRPYIVDEYDQPFWNRWRREAGLVMPAYAAFQDWDAICRFNNPVELAYGASPAARKQAIVPFGIGMDPIARAGETLAALLFRRGDVRPAEHRIVLQRRPRQALAPESARLPLPEGPPGLVFRHAVAGSWQAGEAPAKGTARVDGGGNWRASVILDPDSVADSAAAMSRLITWRRQGDRSDPARGRYESDSGEILIDSSDRHAEVQTERSEVLLFDRGLPLDLAHLSVEAASDGALVALSAHDGRALGKSRRILLIVATDAVNSEIRFSNEARHSLLNVGRLPVLIKTARFDLTVRHEDPDALRLFAVALNGARRQELPLEIGNGKVRFHIDTATLDAGPTTYFELVADAPR